MWLAWARLIRAPSPRCSRCVALRLALALWLILLLAACAPLLSAPAPPQLRHSPGDWVRSPAAGHFDAGLFQVEYPPSWRVIKESGATDPQLKISFAAPDKSYVTLLQVDAAASVAGQRWLRLANGLHLLVSVYPTAEAAADFAAQVERLIASIRS